MPEARSKFLEKIIPEASKAGRRRYTTCGPGEQAFSLRTDYKTGRKKRSIAWSHFSDYEWEDLGDRERLTVIFGDRILTIEGYKLDVLIREIDAGKLKTFEELTTPEVQTLLNDPDEDAVVTSVDIYPSVAEIVREIKGENDDHGKHTRSLNR